MSKKRILFIQHGDVDKPGLLAEVLLGRGIGLETLRPDLGESVPAMLEGYSGLAVGGGPQSAYETDVFPYLAREIELIRQAADSERPVIGLCLGSQLMAATFGGPVRPGATSEIGFFPVTLEPITEYDPVWCGIPKTFVTTHWHGDVFEVPPGGMRMASSAATPNQLFRYGHALYGIQFHLEMTPEILEGMVEASRDTLREIGVEPDRLRAEGRRCLPELRETASTVFSRWADFL